MKKINVEEFVKKVNALQAGEHVSVRLVDEGYIVTAFATLVKGYRYHFMMVEGLYGNCEQGFEGFDEQGVYEYIDYVKNLDTETQELDEITELIVVEEKNKDKEKEELVRRIWDVIVSTGDEGSIGIGEIFICDGVFEIEYLTIEPDGGVTFHAVHKDNKGKCCSDRLEELEMEILEEIYVQIQ